MSMNTADILFLIFEVLAGLALFILGMNIMTSGLRAATGAHLRTILRRATRNRLAGISLGTAVGTLVQSSATTVMLVGFVNAGLMTLLEAIPPVYGANIGTTISMQIISFKLGAYCYFAITLGMLVRLLAPSLRWREGGGILLGFGLLFLGMNIMSDAVKPYREILTPLLTRADGSTLPGMLLGIGVATLVTGIIQSSGATVGMCFALVNAGVFTSVEQIFPIILGAQIGTCATALLGSIGTGIEARRTAVAHLVFNIISAMIGIVAAPLFYRFIPLTSHSLLHQTANLHTASQLTTSLLLLPVVPLHARIVRLLTPSRRPPPEPSALDDQLLAYPERAMRAALSELRRVMHICARSFHLDAQLFFTIVRRYVQEIEANEHVINDIKLAMKDFLASLANRALSRRQAIMIQHLDRCVNDVERIGDHVKSICDLLVDRQRHPQAAFDHRSLEILFELYQLADWIMHLVIESLDPQRTDFQEMARRILEARDEYMQHSIEAKAVLNERIVKREIPPLAGIYLRALVAAFDRIVRHAKAIALAESQPQFWIKRRKLDKQAAAAPPYQPPPLVDPHDFLDKLQREDYI